MKLNHLAALILLSVPRVAAQQAPATWRVSERHILSIGSRDAEGPELFGSIAGAVRLSTGTIVVADRRSLELRLFSPTGKHLKTSGRRGAGPGEFKSIALIQRCARDSVFVYDPALIRMSVFSPEGEYVRTADVRSWTSNGLTPYDIWCNPVGTVAIVQRSHESPKGEGPLRPNVEISLLGPNDSIVSLGTFPATEMYFKVPAAGPRHLGKRTTVAVGSSAVYVGTGDAFEVVAFSSRGRRIGALRDSRPSIPVTAAQVSTYIRDYIAARDDRGNTSGFEQYFRSLEWPKVYPAYASLMVDAAENLWIEEYPIPGEGLGKWTIYTGSGAKVAVISLPKGFRALEAGRDFVLGVWRDEDDVDYLRVYALVKQ